MAALPLIDHRTYTIAVRRMPDFLQALDEFGMPVLLRHMRPPIGFYTSVVGHLNQVVHLWEYEDMADIERRQLARDADPDWPAYLKATVGLVLSQETRLLRRTPLPSLSAERPAVGAP